MSGKTRSGRWQPISARASSACLRPTSGCADPKGWTGTESLSPSSTVESTRSTPRYPTPRKPTGRACAAAPGPRCRSLGSGCAAGTTNARTRSPSIRRKTGTVFAKPARVSRKPTATISLLALATSSPARKTQGRSIRERFGQRGTSTATARIRRQRLQATGCSPLFSVP